MKSTCCFIKTEAIIFQPTAYGSFLRTGWLYSSPSLQLSKKLEYLEWHRLWHQYTKLLHQTTTKCPWYSTISTSVVSSFVPLTSLSIHFDVYPFHWCEVRSHWHFDLHFTLGKCWRALFFIYLEFVFFICIFWENVFWLFFAFYKK